MVTTANQITDLNLLTFELESVAKLDELNGFDDKNYLVIVSEGSGNENIDKVNSDGFVFKVLNSLDSKNPALIEAQHATMKHLNEKGIRCPLPVKNIKNEEYSLEEVAISENKENRNIELNPEVFLVRLLTYVPGVLLNDIDRLTPNICFEIGEYLAILDKHLEDFQHKGFSGHETIWSLKSIPKLRGFLFAIKNEEKQKLILEAVSRFDNEVIPNYSLYKRALIHGDFNEQNIIMKKESDSYRIEGVIDFGDCHYSYLVFELALCLTYSMLISNDQDPIRFGAHIISGYFKRLPLSEEELIALPACIAARLAQSLTLSLYTYSLDSENQYLLSSSKNGWKLLKLILSLSSEDTVKKWKTMFAN